MNIKDFSSYKSMKGKKYQNVPVKFTEKHTTPPPALTESELISLMETNHIGTDASMATHISNIIDREYVMLDSKTRKLECTVLGNSLING